ncbi:MAG: D-amino acid dehydrogenase [Proteobacteria bacterium]|nr:D-amino acid dehydrogenase [Pseudomonadota bacterium]HQR02661.1 D-amino acid dehydrogenase [Rhodocyclaceae bacterium]
MRIVVLGAGVVGVTTAWYLAQSGHEVIVADRQPLPGLETSFANGGQVSVSHAEPWANPMAPLQVLRWLGQEDAPLLWRWRCDPALWRWGIAFLRECLPARTRANIGALVRLGLYSRDCLDALRRELCLDYDHLGHGILHIYTNIHAFGHARDQADVMARYGCERFQCTPERCVEIEPALRDFQSYLAGGIHTPTDESGDAHRFTRALADHCATRGVIFRMGETVVSLEEVQGKVVAARLLTGERLHADAFVVALGCRSTALVRPLGIRLPVYPAKGYSLTIPVEPEDLVPTVSITDDSRKIVFSRLGDRLRVAGTAEFSGYNTAPNPLRAAALARRAVEIFPDIRLPDDLAHWSGLRPATPGNVPIIGSTGLGNLYVNTGHGTLGWTLACGSGRLLADLVNGKPPALPPEPYRPR